MNRNENNLSLYCQNKQITTIMLDLYQACCYVININESNQALIRAISLRNEHDRNL